MLSILLFYLAGLAALVLGISFVVALLWRRTYWRLWGGLALAVPMLLLASIEWARPFLDDGPFHGRPRADCPARAPDQSFVTRSGFRLDSFDAAGTDSVATVRLRTREGKTKWCIRAEGQPRTHVRSVRFREDDRLPLGTIVIEGTVDWTYGRERMSWYLGPWGRLKGYYYSW